MLHILKCIVETQSDLSKSINTISLTLVYLKVFILKKKLGTLKEKESCMNNNYYKKKFLVRCFVWSLLFYL